MDSSVAAGLRGRCLNFALLDVGSRKNRSRLFEQAIWLAGLGQAQHANVFERRRYPTLRLGTAARGFQSTSILYYTLQLSRMPVTAKGIGGGIRAEETSRVRVNRRLVRGQLLRLNPSHDVMWSEAAGLARFTLCFIFDAFEQCPYACGRAACTCCALRNGIAVHSSALKIP